MSFVVKKRFLLLGALLCISRLAAMDDATAVCPFCCEPNFEIGAKLYINAATGEDFSPDEAGNAHIECLRANGLLHRTPESELIYNFLRASGVVAATFIGSSLVNAFNNPACSDNFSEVIVYFQAISLFVPIGIYAKNKISALRNKVKECFSEPVASNTVAHQ